MTPEEARETFIGHALIAYPITKNEEIRGRKLQIFLCFDHLLTEWITDLNNSLDYIGEGLNWHKNLLVEYIDLIFPWLSYTEFEGDVAAKNWRDKNLAELKQLRDRMMPCERDH